MTATPEALRFDRQALELIRADVASVTDAEMTLPTPCEGWNVADLIAHMNREHTAICGVPAGASPVGTDPRAEFAPITERWLALFSTADDTVLIPRLAAELPTQTVLATHAVDMLIHRWDLARARGRTPHTPADLLPRAHAVADLVTAPGSPLTGPEGVYKSPIPAAAGSGSFDALVSKYGRDPNWRQR